MAASRRDFLRWASTGLAAAVPGRAGLLNFAVDPKGTLRANHLPTVDEIWDWQVWMAKLGPKYTGNRAHKTFVDFCAKNLTSLGLEVTRDGYTLPRWDAKRWGITARGSTGAASTVETTGYYPYSGHTPAGGVTAPVIYGGSVADIPRDGKWEVPGASGKIVIADVALAPTPFAEWWRPWGFYAPDTEYPRDYINGTWAIRVPLLDAVKKQGAVGVVFVHTTISDDHARLLYAPFSRPLQDIPALWVGRRAGEQLKALASSGGTVTLTLEADVTPDTPTETLIATLPGVSTDEVIIVNTHTDGPNATEENGPLGVLALARYFSKLSKAERPRTIVFVLATGHFALPYVPSIRGVIEKHPDLIKKAVGAVTVEHLGCTEWMDNASGAYAPTGRKELTIAITEFEMTAKVMLDSVKDTGDKRVAVVTPTPKGGFNGEGGALSRAGVPTIGYIPIPSYLLAGPQNGCIEKLDKAFLYDQVQVLTKAVETMASMGATQLKGRGRATADR